MEEFKNLLKSKTVDSPNEQNCIELAHFSLSSNHPESRIASFSETAIARLEYAPFPNWGKAAKPPYHLYSMTPGVRIEPKMDLRLRVRTINSKRPTEHHSFGLMSQTRCSDCLRVLKA